MPPLPTNNAGVHIIHAGGEHQSFLQIPVISFTEPHRDRCVQKFSSSSVDCPKWVWNYFGGVNVEGFLDSLRQPDWLSERLMNKWSLICS
jgi:hypothetical protein